MTGRTFSREPRDSLRSLGISFLRSRRTRAQPDTNCGISTWPPLMESSTLKMTRLSPCLSLPLLKSSGKSRKCSFRRPFRIMSSRSLCHRTNICPTTIRGISTMIWSSTEPVTPSTLNIPPKIRSHSPILLESRTLVISRIPPPKRHTALFIPMTTNLLTIMTTLFYNPSVVICA